MSMDKIKAEHEIKNLLKQIDKDLEDYQRRLDALGVERREILRLFSRRLERIEVENMQKRVKAKAYGETNN
ncbi:hypothetical protein GF391_03500 [Candidatus Uhrbacteria bacterium]|nr:hypothetical protein [Candidatus Uhrbacteria bacterium]